MREIDMHTWPRRAHFEFFNTFNHPHFNMCVNLDLTEFHAAVKQKGISFTVALVYAISRTANDIREFRQRIRAGKVIEHDIVSPSVTVLVKDDLFGFCTIDYSERFSQFALRATAMMAHAKEHPSLRDEAGQDNLLFMTALPWVSFTSFTHPMRQHPADSIPRFAWGKTFEDDERLRMPLSVQGHHALMDGIHMGRFYARIQDYLGHPEVFLNEG